MASAGGGKAFKDQPWYKKIFLLWTYNGSHAVSEALYGWAFDPLVVVPAAFLVLLFAAASLDPGAVSGTLAMVVALSPVWLPIFLAVFFWVTWMHYIRYMFWFNQEHVLLELQLPPEVEKSPLAMEVFLTAMWNAGGETTFISRVWKGQFRPIFTLEIASHEGQVKFYLHCRKSWRNVLEARLYGQYPEARVTEIEDYVTKIPFNLEDYGLWGAEFKKTEVDALPIKTYIDYGLDKNQDKPETQVDPITNLVEFLGQVGAGEHIWMQIVMKAPKGDSWWYGFPISGNPWKDPALQKIRDITEQAIKRAQSFIDTGNPDEDKKQKAQAAARSSTLLTGGEKLQVEAIERQLTKLYFECGIRVVYLARLANFNGVNIGNVVRFFDPYKQTNYNQIMPVRGNSDFDYPWQDLWDIRQNRVRRNLYFRYKQRAFFFVPYDQVPALLTTEELATIWHFPSSVVETPALDRVPSRRSEAPTNLPI